MLSDLLGTITEAELKNLLEKVAMALERSQDFIESGGVTDPPSFVIGLNRSALGDLQIILSHLSTKTEAKLVGPDCHCEANHPYCANCWGH